MKHLLSLTLLLAAVAQAQTVTPPALPQPAIPVSAVTSTVTSAAASARVRAPAGPVVGLVQNGLAIWEGLPYAQPPVGQWRWRAPRPLPAWSAERLALKPGNVCMQPGSYPGQAGRGSEDCLFLNIYAPQNASNLPVMVWIHGGSFRTGAGSDFDPRTLAREQNVVVVMLNYRLGALGFLAAPGLTENGSVGNYGLLDQQLALKWVRENISAFGGDAGNVTAFGESAGGMSICQQLVMPGSRGLFDKAVIQSGPCTDGGITTARDSALSVGTATAKKLGCGGNDAACLRALPANKLSDVTPPNSGTVPFAPLWGDPTLPQNPVTVLSSPQALGVPLLIGSNLNESRAFAAFLGHKTGDVDLLTYLGAAVVLNKWQALNTLFVYSPRTYGSRVLALSAANTDSSFACPTNDIARRRSAFVPVYSYEYRDETVPNKLPPATGITSYGAFHSSEIASIMGASDSVVNYSAFTPQQLALARTMRTYWANFARTGNPNGAGVPVWTPLTAPDFVVQEFRPQRTGPVNDFRKVHQCDVLWK